MFRIGQPVDRREVAATVAVTLAVMVVSFVTVWSSHATEVAERENFRLQHARGRGPGDAMPWAGHPLPGSRNRLPFRPFDGEGLYGPEGPPPNRPPFGGPPPEDDMQRPDRAAPTVHIRPISLTDVMDSGVPTGDPPEPDTSVL